MKTIQHIFGTAVISLMTAAAVTSCTEGNDWEVDAAYNRLFSVSSSSIEVTPDANTAKVKWTANKQAEYYLIAVERIVADTKTSPIAPNDRIRIYGEDKSITNANYELTGLLADTEYTLAIKAMATGVQDSKWSYLDGGTGTFKTKTEQIFAPVSGDRIGDVYVTLSWQAGAEVDYIEITNAAGESVTRLELTAEQKAAGTATVEGLSQLTAYTATIYLGTTKRGVVSFTTNATLPQADYSETLTDARGLNQELFDRLSEAGYNTVNIVLKSGVTYINEEDQPIALPEGMSVTFFGLPGEKQAVISILKTFDFAGTHEYIRFENVELNGNGNSDYIFNQSKEATVQEIKFSNSYLHGYKNTVFRLQGSSEKLVNQLTFDGCVVESPASSSYSIAHIDAGSGKGKVENILFNNSTFVNSGKNVVMCKKTNFTSLKFQNCTFSKIISAGNYFVDCGDANSGPSNGILIENCLFGSTSVKADGVDVKINGVRSSAAVTVVNSFATADCTITNNKIADLSSYEGTEADLFEDAANLDFTIKDNAFEGKTSCGDPRWYKK